MNVREHIAEHLLHHSQTAKELGDMNLSQDLLKVAFLLTDSVNPNLSLAQLCSDTLSQLRAFYMKTPSDTRVETKTLLDCEVGLVCSDLMWSLQTLASRASVHPVYRLAILRTLALSLQTLEGLVSDQDI